MTRDRDVYFCTECGNEALQWAGRCAVCGAWNSVTLAPSPASSGGSPMQLDGSDGVVRPLRDVQQEGGPARVHPTGVDEFDRVLGGGLVAGSSTLLFGPPGVGKSTLLLQVLRRVAETRPEPTLLISAEESLPQVLGRAERLGSLPEGVLAVDCHDVGVVEAAARQCEPGLIVVDSVQAVRDPELAAGSGSLAQVRACVERLTRLAKSRGVAIILVGHVTKDGELAGPRAIEHLVDTVLSFDGDRHHALRVLTSVKHRFGRTGEVGLFEMREEGLRTVPDPGPLMLGDRVWGEPGSAIVPVLQGRRPLLVEVQALLGVNLSVQAPRPRTFGIDAARVLLLAAVLNRRAGISLAGTEAFVAAAGGISVQEPAVDLAIAIALASAATGTALPHDLVAFGEIGLAGEVRNVPGAARRLSEAQRVGFARALVPASTPYVAFPPGLDVVPVRTLRDALTAAAEPADEPALVLTPLPAASS